MKDYKSSSNPLLSYYGGQINLSLNQASKTNISNLPNENKRELNKEIFQIIQQGGDLNEINNKTKKATKPSLSLSSPQINNIINNSSQDKSETTANSPGNSINNVPINLKKKNEKETLEIKNVPFKDSHPFNNLEIKKNQNVNGIYNNIVKNNSKTVVNQEISNNFYFINNQKKSNYQIYKYDYGKNNNIINNFYPRKSHKFYGNQFNNNCNFFYNYNFFYTFPENAFSFNNFSYENPKNWKFINTGKDRNKNKMKEKLEQKLFVINLDNILKGIELRTTVMIRHIPNKYTTKTLMEEIDIACKNKYDFFYLPIDSENNCNLGYSFINFINPLHIIYFYNQFKSRKWKFYNSQKECDLTFAKFQGKSELTSHLCGNISKIEDQKKMPVIFNIANPPKIDMYKYYYEKIKTFQPELIKEIKWV